VLVDLVQRGAGEVVGVGEQPIGGVALVAGEFPRCGLGAVEQVGDAAAKLDVARRLPQVPGGSGVAAQFVEVWWLGALAVAAGPHGAGDHVVGQQRVADVTDGIELDAAVGRQGEWLAGEVDHLDLQDAGEVDHDRHAVHRADAPLDLGQPALRAADQVSEYALGQAAPLPPVGDPLAHGHVWSDCHAAALPAQGGSCPGTRRCDANPHLRTSRAPAPLCVRTFVRNAPSCFVRVVRRLRAYAGGHEAERAFDARPWAAAPLWTCGARASGTRP
jgi:hypothetical protein